MNMELFLLHAAIVILSVNNAAASYPAIDGETSGSGLNLNGKMFTLSGGGLCFYSPNQPSPWYSTPNPYYTTTQISNVPPTTIYPTSATTVQTITTPYPNTPTTTTPTTTTPTTTTPTTTTPTTTTATTTTPTTTTTTPMTTTTTPTTTTQTTTTYPTTTTSHPWTTAPTITGVSVCLRFITDFMASSSPNIFTLSPSSTRLTLNVNTASYILYYYNGYNRVYLRPNLRLWWDLGPSMWTSTCFTMDTTKGVVQVFTNTNMSMRKVLPNRFQWSGEPVIDFSGFEGQVTDVEVWDYPLTYKNVLYYMSRGTYGYYQGSVLTWSNIRYSLRGNTLLENSYEKLMKQPGKRGAAGNLLKRNRSMKFLQESERKRTRKQQM